MTSSLRDLATARLLATYLTDQQSLNEAFLARVPRGYRDRVYRELQNVLQTATTEIRLSTTLFRRRMADLREERKRRRSFYFQLVFGCFLLGCFFIFLGGMVATSLRADDPNCYRYGQRPATRAVDVHPDVKAAADATRTGWGRRKATRTRAEWAAAAGAFKAGI